MSAALTGSGTGTHSATGQLKVPIVYAGSGNGIHKGLSALGSSGLLSGRGTGRCEGLAWLRGGNINAPDETSTLVIDSPFLD